MPIILPIGTSFAAAQTQTTTGQAIVNAVSQDVRSQLANNGTDTNIILDWLNRVQLTMLRSSRWQFLLSDVQYFITEREQSDYWIGVARQAPAGTVDTNLNLADVDRVQRSSVTDVSNARPLEKTSERPFSLSLSTRDAQFKPGLPAEWRQDLFSPNILSLYPAPDNQNNYQPIAQTPYVTAGPGGALAQRTYYVYTTLVDSLGNESTPNAREAVQTIPANQLATVHSPILPFNTTTQGVVYNQYKVYASTTSNGELLQTASPIPIGTNWTEPTSGLVTGTVAPPTNNAVTVLDGYIIAFRYYRMRQIVQNLSDVLQVPDIYKDIVVEGVMYYACRFLRLKEDAMLSMQGFKDGLRQMVNDRNLFPTENDFIHADASSIGIGTQVPYSDVFDYIR